MCVLAVDWDFRVWACEGSRKGLRWREREDDDVTEKGKERLISERHLDSLVRGF